jgi:putative membrane protein
MADTSPTASLRHGSSRERSIGRPADLPGLLPEALSDEVPQERSGETASGETASGETAYDRAGEDGSAGPNRRPREPIVLIAVTMLALIVSGIDPYDRATWILEVFPVVVAVALLLATYRRFPLTLLAYRLLFAHALILIVGGHYTYARVPAGFFIQDLLELGRNHYDRFAHVAQGFVPAIVVRELLIRLSPLSPGGWLWLTVTSVCLAFSALYELLEWGVAVVFGGGAVEFLGTQGDPWDAQWDMFLALLGALAAQTLLGALHDRRLRALAA